MEPYRTSPQIARQNLAGMPWSLRRRPDERRDMLTQIAACSGLFHTSTGNAYADLLVDGHRRLSLTARGGSERGRSG